MLIPGRAAEEIHLSGGFIYAGRTSHADSCLVLTVGFWSCSSLLLHGAIEWCEKTEWCFFRLSPQGDTVDLFSASSCEALMSSGELCPSWPDVSKGNNHPLSDQAFQRFLLAAFEMTEREVWLFLVLVPWPKLVQVTWDFSETRI